MSDSDLHAALGLAPGEAPFPWQEALLAAFRRGALPRSLDIPTGLGKTSVMAVWLVARAAGAAIPRRLVYVVDRRAVVDQATRVALELRAWVDRAPEVKRQLGLDERSLPISTLRGQHADNREWLEDPAAPAIVVGTVDMVGSRLLFEGYGTSRKMRPYHAALLGCDTLLVLDEAHLVPPFEALIASIAKDAALWSGEGWIPRLRLLSLSATGRGHDGEVFALTEEDRGHTVVRKRLGATKRLTFEAPGGKESLAQALAARAWALSERGSAPIGCVVYSDRREDALSAKSELEKLAKGASVDTELLVGGRRVFEREDVEGWLRSRGFFPTGSAASPSANAPQMGLFDAPSARSAPRRERPAFLFATSAGEVGVDLDADHMVSDLVAWERMVQRLGRVNRRGEGEACVLVVDAPLPGVDKAREKDKPNDKDRVLIERDDRRRATRWLLEQLPEQNASPGALGALRAIKGSADRIALATTPAPLRPALTRALLDAWSMTSLREHTGRPEVGPWLRGWDEEDPQTAILWRTHLPISRQRRIREVEVERFFEAAPPHASEILETETFRAVEWLSERATRCRAAKALLDDEVVAVVLSRAGDRPRPWTLGELAGGDARELNRALVERILVVDARLGGLSAGLLDEGSDEVPETLDGGPWRGLAQGDPPVVRFRVRERGAGERDPEPEGRWRERYRLALSQEGDDVPRRLVVEKWGADATTEEDRSISRCAQPLEEHASWAAARAGALARRLGLREEHEKMLVTAARLHDEGKRAPRWQRAANVPSDGVVYAKSDKPMNVALLDGYRHELGSLPLAERDPELQSLPPELRELTLHLIAAHHGFARPTIGTSGCEDAPPSALVQRAQAVAMRFAALQRRWGPWGLAWWEALLRAADQQASRQNDDRKQR